MVHVEDITTQRRRGQLQSLCEVLHSIGVPANQEQHLQFILIQEIITMT